MAKRVLRLLLIRHAESEANIKAEFVSGRSNHINLTPLGNKQAQALGTFLAETEKTHGFHRIFASTAVRAQQTAKLCLQAMKAANGANWNSVEIESSDELLEIEMGDFVGHERVNVYTPAVIEEINKDPWNFAPPNGESMKQVEERVSTFIKKNITGPFLDGANPPDQDVAQPSVLTVVIFFHGLAIKCFLRHILESNPALTYKFVIHNTSVSELLYDDQGWHFVRMNDQSHLAHNNLPVT